MLLLDELLNEILDLALEDCPEGVSLASGKSSDVYINVKRALLSWGPMFKCGRIISRMLFDLHIKEGETNFVAGTGLGGALLASAVIMEAHYELHYPLYQIHVRSQVKEHGTQQEIETPTRASEPHPVYFLEDVVTTGGSALRAIDVLQGKGYEVRGCICVVDRQEGAQEAFENRGIPLISLLTKKQILDASIERATSAILSRSTEED